MKKYLIPVVAIGCITLLEIIALVKGVDGIVLSLAIGLIGGVLGNGIKK